MERKDLIAQIACRGFTGPEVFILLFEYLKIPLTKKKKNISKGAVSHNVLYYYQQLSVARSQVDFHANNYILSNYQ